MNIPEIIIVTASKQKELFSSAKPENIFGGVMIQFTLFIMIYNVVTS